MQTSRIKEKLLFFLLMFFTFWVLVKSAWVSDDAYISFRSVANFVNGYGLTWNVGERVQAFTNPLWVFIMSFIYYLTADMYHSSIALSLFCSLTTFALILYYFGLKRGSLAFVILLSSKAFVDFSSSGLENPLSYLLLLSFICYFYKISEYKLKELTILAFLGSLLILNRIDLILFVAPVLVYSIYKVYINYSWKELKLSPISRVFFAFTPLWLWEMFSIIYYGFPFPNTYYAKLNTLLPFIRKFRSGGAYYYTSLVQDFPTLVWIAFALISVYFLRREIRDRVVAFGIVLYLAYIFKIGGDFMSGRFFAVPVLLSSFLLVKEKNFNFLCKAIIPVAFIALLALPRHPLRVDESYDYQEVRYGISDERGYYYQSYGLIASGRKISLEYGSREKYTKGLKVIWAFAGYHGYLSKPDQYVLEKLALTNPLLARIPAKIGSIGHYGRELPKGYMRSIELGKNEIEDPKIHLFYEHLNRVTRGPVWSMERFKTIAYMNLGVYDFLVHTDYETEDDRL
jgi:arabinofuranosyltransferase